MAETNRAHLALQRDRAHFAVDGCAGSALGVTDNEREARIIMTGIHGELTPREMQVAELIADGASSKEAGRRLGISPRTVDLHRAHIMEKLGARNAAELVRIVLLRGSRSDPS
jgi:DNA-binding CsgD family transcriptional regulator